MDIEIIILDFNQICISNFMMAVKNHTNIDPDIDLIRHMILNSIRSSNSKYRKNYGELVIATDGANVWRKDFYPYYKANRKKEKSKSDVNWPMLMGAINTIRQEIIDNFPYRTLNIEGCEADDIIAVLAKQSKEPVLIVSGDKDFKQLQSLGSHIKQYDTIRSQWLVCDDPKDFLLEHIIKGDRGDGVPNILSDDDTFVVEGKRQKIMTAKRLNEIKENNFDVDYVDPVKVERNRRLIDLTKIPDNMSNIIIESFKNSKDDFPTDLYSYFVEHNLTKLMTSLDDFRVGSIESKSIEGMFL